jgi:hypothetical protein
MRGKARDILFLQRITDFSTTGSAGLARRNNGRNTDLLHFSTRKHNLGFFSRQNHILTVELHRSILYILFSGENAR